MEPKAFAHLNGTYLSVVVILSSGERVILSTPVDSSGLPAVHVDVSEDLGAVTFEVMHDEHVEATILQEMLTSLLP